MRILRRVEARSTALLRAGSVVLPVPAPPSAVLFLIGCPRSGTSILFELLRKSPALASPGREGHVLWEAFHHPSDRDWDSNALGAGDVSRRERAYVYFLVRAMARRRGFVDKTPKNCLRIPYLLDLFPEARFVFLHRRPEDNVNSLIEGWRASPRFRTYTLPELLEGPGTPGEGAWSFVLIPGWRELRQAPLEEICARQYLACNEAALAAREAVDPSRWIELAYEDLVARPREETATLFDDLGLAVTAEVATYAAEITTSPVNIVTPPRSGKWREQNPAEVEAIKPLVASLAERLGYAAD